MAKITILEGYDGVPDFGEHRRRRRTSSRRSASQNRFARAARHCAMKYGDGSRNSRFKRCMSSELKKKKS